jgi:hypothetical protein
MNPDELDPPVGGATTLVTAKMFKIENVRRRMMRYTVDCLRFLTPRIISQIFDISLIIEHQERSMGGEE